MNFRKRGFKDRVVCFVAKGKYKGTFILNIKEKDTTDSKAVVVYPEGELRFLPNKVVRESFKNGTFLAVEKIPKNIYAVCVGQLEGGSNDTPD